MNKFAYILRAYPMNGGDYPSVEAPPATMQQNGFKPTFKDPDGNLSVGDPVEYKHLNFIFNDLYAKAADMESRLTALEGE
ncbi:hypothetical protein NFK58_12855 [Citrobacter portucalensis]|uniref:hypothetical protein n=1 Tax=Citrobacter portucalensis TaxID=1639133 RepID=UPI00242DB4A0|nr:hypothetical protein [Citrobacter portucalensis]WFZ22197.1 hypothetical protein NFK58_12855 [Citrobacter portucalensis]